MKVVKQLRADLGSVLPLVLILITLTTVTATESLRSGLMQLNMTHQRFVWAQAEQAMQSAIDCVLTHLDKQTLLNWMIYTGSHPNLTATTAGQTVSGCATTYTTDIQYHQFNQSPAQTYTEYMGDVAGSITISNVEYFHRYQFQTWALGQASTHDSVAMQVVQGWEILLPKDVSFPQASENLTTALVRTLYWRIIE